MPSFTDQTGRRVDLKGIPKRIISLVPSQTELLCDLGLEEALVGITKFCVHPEHLKASKEIIGGTKKLRFGSITALHPDLIIANKEENTREDIEFLLESFPVYISDIATPDDSIAFTRSIGDICGRSAEADLLIEKLKSCYSEIRALGNLLTAKKALYLIWKNPYMAAGSDTYISEMLRLCGLENRLDSQDEKGMRYPSLSKADILTFNPDLILLSSEPYPFSQKDVDELESSTGIPVKYVDGEIFSWYGSRIIHDLNEIKRFIHEIE